MNSVFLTVRAWRYRKEHRTWTCIVEKTHWTKHFTVLNAGGGYGFCFWWDIFRVAQAKSDTTNLFNIILKTSLMIQRFPPTINCAII